jgi:hypothetical protein
MIWEDHEWWQHKDLKAVMACFKVLFQNMPRDIETTKELSWDRQ